MSVLTKAPYGATTGQPPGHFIHRGTGGMKHCRTAVRHEVLTIEAESNHPLEHIVHRNNRWLAIVVALRVEHAQK